MTYEIDFFNNEMHARNVYISDKTTTKNKQDSLWLPPMIASSALSCVNTRGADVVPFQWNQLHLGNTLHNRDVTQLEASSFGCCRRVYATGWFRWVYRESEPGWGTDHRGSGGSVVTVRCTKDFSKCFHIISSV